VSGQVITPCVQLCRIWEPSQDIESRVIYLHCVCGGLCDSGENEKDCMISVYN